MSFNEVYVLIKKNVDI